MTARKSTLGLNAAKLVIVSLVFLPLLPMRSYAQGKSLSPPAQELTDALAELQKKPDDPVVQERYLEAFPHSYKSFLELFGYPNGQLYDGSDYIEVLPQIAEQHETEVGGLLVQLSKDAQKEADAPTYLQMATATYASHHTKTFAALLNALSLPKRAHLIGFLADVENFDPYEEYQAVINNLKRLGQPRLAKQFEAARKKRSQLPKG